MYGCKENWSGPTALLPNESLKGLSNVMTSGVGVLSAKDILIAHISVLKGMDFYYAYVIL